jgi:hypothetical protein
MRDRGTPLRTLDRGAGRGWSWKGLVVSATPRPIYLGELIGKDSVQIDQFVSLASLVLQCLLNC